MTSHLNPYRPDDTLLYFAKLKLGLELRRTHGVTFATAFLEEFAAQVQTAAVNGCRAPTISAKPPRF